MNRTAIFLSLFASAGTVLAQPPGKPAEEMVDLQARKRVELRELLRTQRRSAPAPAPAAQRQLTAKERAELRELLRQQHRPGARQ